MVLEAIVTGHFKNFDCNCNCNCYPDTFGVRLYGIGYKTLHIYTSGKWRPFWFTSYLDVGEYSNWSYYVPGPQQCRGSRWNLVAILYTSWDIGHWTCTSGKWRQPWIDLSLRRRRISTVVSLSWWTRTMRGWLLQFVAGNCSTSVIRAACVSGITFAILNSSWSRLEFSRL